MFLFCSRTFGGHCSCIDFLFRIFWNPNYVTMETLIHPVYFITSMKGLLDFPSLSEEPSQNSKDKTVRIKEVRTKNSEDKNSKDKNSKDIIQ